MVRYEYGTDLFTLKTDCIVNPVNCVGVAGKGLALAFKQRYPTNYARYAQACHQGLLKPGGVLVDPTTTPVIISLATKDHWRNDSLNQYIQDGLAALVKAMRATPGLRTVGLPAIGAGNGKLPETEVREMVAKAFAGPDLSAVYCIPRSRPTY